MHLPNDEHTVVIYYLLMPDNNIPKKKIDNQLIFALPDQLLLNTDRRLKSLKYYGTVPAV